MHISWSTLVLLFVEVVNPLILLLAITLNLVFFLLHVPEYPLFLKFEPLLVSMRLFNFYML
jgi:hypothetical protein